MKNAEMAELFDVELDDANDGGSSDYDVTAEDEKDGTASFDQKLDAMQSLIESNDVPDRQAAETEDVEIDVDVEVETGESEVSSKDEGEAITKMVESVEDPSQGNNDIPFDPDPDPDDSPLEPEALEPDARGEEIGESAGSPDEPEEASPENDNPLGLSGDDLDGYKMVLEQYPQFTLYNGSPAYKDFYACKTRWLRDLLTKFRLLDLADLHEEVQKIELDHVLQHDAIHADLIKVKLGDVQMWRTRLTSLELEATGQLNLWKKATNLLRSKLWKDHDVKGAHRRDGVTQEHMSDIECYVSELEGFVEMCKHVDSLLKAATDTLSRQATCIQISKESTTPIYTKEEHKAEPPAEKDSSLDHMDSIEHGESIETGPTSRAPLDVNFGAGSEDDDLLDL